MSRARHMFVDACERNKGPILQQLQRLFGNDPQLRLLEIGSGTAQHLIHITESLPRIDWQPSDVGDHNVRDLRDRLSEPDCRDRPNVRDPIRLDVGNSNDWQRAQGLFDVVFASNVLHIVDWPRCESLFKGAAAALKPSGGGDSSRLLVYGPFNYDGKFVSEGNVRLDAMLRRMDAGSGIRDQEAVCALAGRFGFELIEDVAMPSNNRFLVFGLGARVDGE